MDQLTVKHEQVSPPALYRRLYVDLARVAASACRCS
ncbi:putative leader peptide [Streptomyces sp. NPDC042319]